MNERPSGTVTFLFTDIEGSTRLWEQHPDAMGEALARHDEIVRSAIEGHGGYVFATGGDGFAAAFPTADSAVGAAVDAQAALTLDASADALGLRARMGLHTGIAQERDGDYFGEAPTRASRIMATAWGGQIVCSDVSAQLLTSVDELVSLGEHRLRDLTEAQQLWQVGLQDSAFPPLRSLNEAVGNLPQLLTQLIGREELVGSLVGRLNHDRLLTLTGVGGVGKTRLALQVGAEANLDFPDGCWLVELAPVREPHEVADAMLATLRIAQRSGMTALESVIDYVHNQRMLVLLDNCEHVVGGARRAAEQVLSSCPNVRIVATSREGLGLGFEQIVAVPSLDVPFDGDSVAGSPSVQLFLDRADALGSWQPEAGDLVHVAELCRRLDGIPLAIELAAGRVAVLSPEDIVAHMDDRFRVLTGRRGGHLERHQTLRAAVQWSYDLLDDHERAAFDRMGVFVGSFDLAAATAVAGDGVDQFEMADIVQGLLSRSMVQAERDRGHQRYRLLETLRQFAIDNLVESGEIETARWRHAEHQASESVRLGALLKTPEEPAAYAQLEAQLSDLRAAVAYAVDEEDGMLAAALLGPYYAGPASYVRGVTSLASAGVVELASGDRDWGTALLAIAMWDSYLEDSDQQALLEAAKSAIAVEAVDRRDIVSEVERAVAGLAAVSGDAATAISMSEEAARTASASGSRYAQVNAQIGMAVWSNGFGRTTPGMAEAALAGATELGAPFLQRAAEFAVAYEVELSDTERALSLASSSRGYPPTGHWSDSFLESVAGRILLRRGDYLESLRSLELHMTASLRAGMRIEFAYSAATAAGCLAALGQADTAAVVHSAFAGGTDWTRQVDAERVADELIDQALDPQERRALAERGRELDYPDAAELALTAVRGMIANGGTDE